MNTVNIPNDQMIQNDQEPGGMMIEEEKKATNDVNVKIRHNEDIKREVQKALEYNNNAQAAVEIMKKYNLRHLDESSIREWIKTYKYCAKEDVEKAKKKIQIRISSTTNEDVEDHLERKS